VAKYSTYCIHSRLIRQLNVFLPDFPVPEKAEEALKAKKYIEDKLFEGDAFCAIVSHAEADRIHC
jgi:hypothetical protein